MCSISETVHMRVLHSPAVMSLPPNTDWPHFEEIRTARTDTERARDHLIEHFHLRLHGYLNAAPAALKPPTTNHCH